MKFLFAICFLVLSGMAIAEYGLHFDDSGNIIKPDQYYLAKGIKDDKDGFKNDALKNFKKAAEFGNQYAMSLIALYHMQDKDYVAALAWFNMLDLKKIPNSDFLKAIITNLEKISEPEQIQAAGAMKADLSETYGHYPTLLRREAWKKSLKFTGTHIKGYIPPFLTIQLNSGMVVTGHNVRRQVDNFIYEYEFDFGQGNVTLEDIELIEAEEKEQPE
ncbi:MAG: hypothetical protein DWP95_11200 [Proteobacteria bacterium]|nr:MAG: hypothetical protein DWP95_11200 [Pseudomonadota bacterium]